MSDEEQVLFELALTLGMPVYKIVEEMPYEEFLSWLAFFEIRPTGWREDLRTSYIMRSFGDKRQPSEMFDSIAKVMSNSKPREAIDSLKTSYLFSKMLSAKGGDKVKAIEEL